LFHDKIYVRKFETGEQKWTRPEKQRLKTIFQVVLDLTSGSPALERKKRKKRNIILSFTLCLKNNIDK